MATQTRSAGKGLNLAHKVVEILEDIADHFTPAVKIGKRLLWAAATLKSDARLFAASPKALEASREWISFCRDHPGDHRSHEWYQHIGRLGGRWRGIYRRQKETLLELVKALPEADGARRLVMASWPRIRVQESRWLAASRKKAATATDSELHRIATQLQGHYRRLVEALRATAS